MRFVRCICDIAQSLKVLVDIEQTRLEQDVQENNLLSQILTALQHPQPIVGKPVVGIVKLGKAVEQ